MGAPAFAFPFAGHTVLIAATYFEEYMKRIRLALIVCAFAIWSGFQAEIAWAGDHQYRYVSLDGLPMPAGFAGYAFYLGVINDGDRVYGNVCNDAAVCFAAVYEHGAVKVLQPRQLPDTPFFVSAANRHTVGGSVPDPADPSRAQAAILQKRNLELVAAPATAVYSFVLGLTDLGPLVDSFDVSGTETYSFFHRGRVLPVDLTPVVNAVFVHVNDHGIIAGTGANGRGFRLDSRTGANMQLDPLPTEPFAWGMGINNGGEVLGYSFVFGGTERIGVWDTEGRFRTYFVEGTPEVPTISNRLFFNDSNLIVITATTDGNSYIVPEPGQRLNLADLTENLPATEFPLSNVQGINNHGSLVGFGSAGNQFLLRRIDRDGHCEEGEDDEAR
jgi:hypothetical protein